MTITKIALLHVYPQIGEHTPVIIVGNHMALSFLRDELIHMLTTGQETGSVQDLFAGDGEGYCLQFVVDNSTWQTEAWSKREAPYAKPGSWRDSDSREWEMNLPTEEKP